MILWFDVLFVMLLFWAADRAIRDDKPNALYALALIGVFLIAVMVECF